MTDLEVRGLLMSVSTTFGRIMKHNFKPEEVLGKYLVTLFLDTVLADSCSPQVRLAFIQAFTEQRAKCEKSAA